MFPEFVEKRFGIPAKCLYPYFRWFHSNSAAVLVPTKGIKDYLEEKGFRNLHVWTRGVNRDIFNPERRTRPQNYIVCVSRVSKEKGLDDFCKLHYTRKVLIGDGPYLKELKSKYPDVEMIGKKEGVELAEWVANADVFVFPSKTDTFGIVILESLGCGTPVAAYNEPGPRETIIPGYNGYIDDCLERAVKMCLNIDREGVFESSKKWTWQKTSNIFSTIVNQ
jgi:glycosyltransferase involved in cell wall biosynthesis